MDKNCLLLINSWPQANTPLQEALDMASTLQLFGHKVNVHMTDSALLLLQKDNQEWSDTFSMMQEMGVEFSTSLDSMLNYSSVTPAITVHALRNEDANHLKKNAHFVWSC
ncbi:MAG TPA: DsrE family protein [Alcanivoracaceae bacterium]|nr:DsrE family protein [Alcanivoracaceae bacterium]